MVQDKYKIKINPEVYLGPNFPYDPGGTMINIWKSYMKKLIYFSKTNFLHIYIFHLKTSSYDKERES